MRLVVDTSAVIAVIAGEPQRDRLIEMTSGAELLAPDSLHWEVGNALAGQLRRGRCTLEQAREFIARYQEVPIQFVDVALDDAVEEAQALGLYAYDAYMVVCARNHRCPLLTLDRDLIRAASEAGLEVMEVT